MILALGFHVALGGAWPSLPTADKIPLAVANFGLVFLIGGPLGEEFGWRGYLMPALSVRLKWRIASLVVGILWGLWHIPLFFLPGTAQSQMSIDVFLLNILASSVIFGWLYERTQGSVLPALILHTSLNAWAGILRIVPTPGADRPYLLVTALLAVVATCVLFRSNTLAFAGSRGITSAD